MSMRWLEVISWPAWALDAWDWLRRAQIRHALNAEARIDFYDALGTQLSSGVSLTQTLRSQYAIHSHGGKRESDPVATVIAEMLSDLVHEGSKVAPALSRWVTQTEVAIIAAGEKAGGDERGKAFDRCMVALERRARLVAAIQKPIGYGLFMLAFDIASLFPLAYWWAPEIVTQHPRVTMGTSTGLLYDWVVFFRSWWPLLFIVGASASAAIAWSLGNTKRSGRVGRLVSKLPPWSVYEIFQDAQFADNIANMVGGLVKEREAVELLKNYASPWLALRLEDLRFLMADDGKKFGTAMLLSRYGFPNRATAYFMNDIQGVKNYQDKMAKYADRSMKSHIKRIERASSVLNVGLFLVTAAWILFVLNAAVYALIGLTNNH